MPTTDEIYAALSTVQDPEIHRSLTELNMVESVNLTGGKLKLGIKLTVAGCPMRDEITNRVVTAITNLDQAITTEITFSVMTDEERAALRLQLKGGVERENPFNAPDSMTKVIAIASGKGGVGKSSLTANLAVALTQLGRRVGVIDADIYGHSIPRLLTANGAPTMVEGMMMPPQGYGIKVISTLPFKRGGVSEPVAFRGPMLHKMLDQFLCDVWWGDLDFLLIDLPPGTGDVAISTAHLVPRSEVIVVTSGHEAAAEVAVRAGVLAHHLNQRVIGVIENLSGLNCPHCGELIDVFGMGAGRELAKLLSAETKTEIEVLGEIPIDPNVRKAGDSGIPIMIADPTCPSAIAIMAIAQRLASTPRGLLGQSLKVSPI
jgi:ATP-binding protein involved in chromosome partitioning